MRPRYSLRFESGERAGELVPISGSPFLVGRKPGSSFQLLMKSVSGRHAELVQVGSDLEVRDLGSTNGTRVNGKKVTEATLQPGDRLFLGDVEFQVLFEGEAATPMGAGGDTDAVELDLEGELELELEEPSAAPMPMPAKRVAPDPARSQPATPSPAPSAPKAAPKAAPAQPAPRSQQGGFELEGDLTGMDAAHEVSASSLERSAKGGSKLPLLLLGLGFIGAGAGWWFFGRGGDEGGPALRPVTPVAGNQLTGSPSFESDGGWNAREGASDSFRLSAGSRVSGARGVRVDLGAGGSAFHESEPIKLPVGRRFAASVSLRRGPDASAALGVLLFHSSEGERAPGSTTVWSTPAESGAAFAELRVSGPIPNGYDRARVVIAAGAAPAPEGTAPEDIEIEAWAEADDVAFLIENDGAATHTLDEVRFYGMGDPLHALAIFKIDALVVSGLRVRERGAWGPGGGLLPLSLTEEAQGVRVAWSGAGPVNLSARVEARLVDQGLATLGAGGYGPRGGAFEAEAVTDILAGSGNDLVRFALGSESKVVGSPTGSGLRLEVQLPAKGSVLLQTRFRDERTEALNLATSARQATTRGDRGEALGHWKELLTRYPYEAAAVAEADEARSTLVQEGLASLQELGEEVERARFFGLADLYRQCRAAAAEIEQAYDGSEVASAAAELVGVLDEELRSLGAGEGALEVGRLQAIQAGLQQVSASHLAAAVASYIEEHAKTEDDAGEER